MEKENKPIISKITIQIGDTKANFTMDQARKLHAALSEMFGIKEVEKVVYRDWSWPWNRPVYTYPYYYGSSYGGTSLLSNDLSGNDMVIGGNALGNLSPVGKCTLTTNTTDKMHLEPVVLAGNDYCLCID